MKIKRCAVIMMVVLAFLAVAGFLQAKMTFQRLPLRTAPEGLKPAPDGFYGGMDYYGTNIVLGWSNAPGAVCYWVERGVTSTNSRHYIWMSFCLSSNASFFVDNKVVNDDLGLNVYRLFAEYPKRIMSDTDVWYACWKDENSSSDDGPLLGPPKPENIQASVDSVTNVVVTWDSAQGPATNYIIIRGVYDSANTNGYEFNLIGTVDSATTSFKATGVIKSTNDLHDIFEVGAIYPGDCLSTFAACCIGTNLLAP